MSIQAESEEPMANQQKKPAHEIRMGRVKATLWANETNNGVRYNVTFSRLYKDGNEWKQTDSFGRDDLPLVKKVADRVHDWIFDSSSVASAGEG